MSKPLNVGPGSMDVLIGNKPAWRGIGGGGAASVQSAKKASEVKIEAAEKATIAAAGTPGAAAAKTNEETVKAAEATAMGVTITSSAAGADIHTCPQPLPAPPHGPGVIVDGSQTVLINNLPACREGDTIVEAIGPPNKVQMGEQTVDIGDSGSGGGGGGGAAGGGGGGGSDDSPSASTTAQGAAMSSARQAGAPFCEECSRM